MALWRGVMGRRGADGTNRDDDADLEIDADTGATAVRDGAGGWGERRFRSPKAWDLRRLGLGREEIDDTARNYCTARAESTDDGVGFWIRSRIRAEGKGP
jgi:hypothetical protein